MSELCHSLPLHWSEDWSKDNTEENPTESKKSTQIGVDSSDTTAIQKNWRKGPAKTALHTKSLTSLIRF